MNGPKPKYEITFTINRDVVQVKGESGDCESGVTKREQGLGIRAEWEV